MNFCIRNIIVTSLCWVLAAGCASSTSSQSSQSSSESGSDSSSSVSNSLGSVSGSSSASSREGAYRSDVEDFTEHWLRTGGDAAVFYQGVAAIAEEHGITNWQSEDITYEAIGRALRRGDVSEARYQSVKDMLSGSPKAAGWIDKGYGK